MFSTFIKGSRRALLLLVAIFSNTVLVGTAGADPVPTQRNFLFIAVDDLRNWVNYSGEYPGSVHTPNIDALAAVSTRYLNAYATVPHCIGSRTSVMMGMSPATHHLTTELWGIEPVYNAIYQNPALLSLPEVLRLHGYHTARAGKVFNAPEPARWDEAGPTPQDPTFNAFDPGPDGTFFQAQVLPPGEEHVDQTVANWATNFLATYTGSNPFFLAVGFREPHVPWRVPQWAYDLYPPGAVNTPDPTPGDLDDEPAAALDLIRPPGVTTTQYDLVEAAGKATEYTRAYLAAISHTDAMVGQLLAALAASPYANTTDVVFWSDHGFHLGEKFRWQKGTFWQPAVKVPLLVSSPGNPNYPPIDVTAAVSLLDVAPTVLDLAGLAPYPQFEGVPLRTAGTHGGVSIYFNDGRATITQAGRKTIDYHLGVPGNQDVAGYQLTTDQHEETNLWANGPPGGC